MRALCACALTVAVGCAAPNHSVVPATPYSAVDATVELHAHLFMKQALGWAFRGEFNGPLAGQSWSATGRSQANPETVERSGIGLLVVSLAAYPAFRLSQRKAVREQVALARRFVAEHPAWVMARNAAQARAALADGRRVIVLALERASHVIETDADIDDYVERDGIAIQTSLPLHDDRPGGTAFLPGGRALIKGWDAAFFSHRDHDHVLLNDHGLTETGRTLARKLMAHGVWLDIAHASDASARELVALDEAAGLPVLISHTTLRKYLHAERAAPDWELAAVRRSDGVVGLVPSEEMLRGTPLAPAMVCARSKAGGIAALAVQYAELRTRISAESIALGSDYSDGISHLHPGCPLGTELDAEGLWNIGQAGAVWQSLEKLGAGVPQPRRTVLDHFLTAWARVRAN